MSEHIDVEVLSDLVEGLLTTAEAAALDAHLAECGECRDTRDALVEVRELLGGQPAEPMPADVIARIDDALALAALPPPRPAEPPTPLPMPVSVVTPPRAPSTPPTEHGAPPTEHVVVPLDRARRRRRGPLLLIAAAAAAVALGVTIVVGTGDDGDSDHRSSAVKSNTDASAPKAAAPPGKSGERPGANAEEHTPQTPLASSTAAPTVYTAAGLADQVSLLLHRADRAPRELPTCVAAAVGPDAPRALAADPGSYTGKPAWVVVLPGSNTDRVRVYIVDASCVPRSTADASASPPAAVPPSTAFAGALLLSTEVPRR
ncbi:anti-sigma factor family protein [Embleya sp. NPDC020630]|uniref:anti-sigma factor family protein n=1 Tax=Embleya sp. NPDC020630 TaxID=3363979 RepID=UPI0037887563